MSTAAVTATAAASPSSTTVSVKNRAKMFESLASSTDPNPNDEGLGSSSGGGGPYAFRPSPVAANAAATVSILRSSIISSTSRNSFSGSITSGASSGSDRTGFGGGRAVVSGSPFLTNSSKVSASPPSQRPMYSTATTSSALNVKKFGGWTSQSQQQSRVAVELSAGTPTKSDGASASDAPVEGDDDDDEDDVNVIPTPSSPLPLKEQPQQQQQNNNHNVICNNVSINDMRPVFLPTKNVRDGMNNIIAKSSNGIQKNSSDVRGKVLSAATSPAEAEAEHENAKSVDGNDNRTADENNSRSSNENAVIIQVAQNRHHERRTERYLRAKQRSTSPALGRAGGGIVSGSTDKIVRSNAIATATAAVLKPNFGVDAMSVPPLSSLSPYGSNGLKAANQSSNPTSLLFHGEEGGHTSNYKSTNNRETRTVPKPIDQEARRALLSATMKRKETTTSSSAPITTSADFPTAPTTPSNASDVAERVGEKANRAVAMKKATKMKNHIIHDFQNNTDHQRGSDSVIHSCIESTRSYDSGKTRRSEHPAIAGRKGTSSIGAPSKLSSADLLTSFRQFNATRIGSEKGKTSVDRRIHTKTTIEQSHQRAGLKTNEIKWSPSNIDENQSLNSAEGSTDQNLFDLEDSMHSMNDTQYQQNLYEVERITVATKQSFNDTYLSSLSSNTFSIQSLKSPGGMSTLPSPVSFNQREFVRGSKTSPVLEPTQENSSSTQTMKSELVVGLLSPGPSHRSTHSVANSIISASPSNRGNPGSRSANNISEADGLLASALEAVTEETMNSDTKSHCDYKDPSCAIAPSDCTKEPGIQGHEGDILDSLQHTQKDLATEDITQLASSSSARSISPPGFVFKDIDESEDLAVVKDPDAKQISQFLLSDDLGGASSTAGLQSGDQPSTGMPKPYVGAQELSSEKAIVQKPNDVGPQQQGSTSTKQTVSTSIRTGMSSIQNEPVDVYGIPSKTPEGLLEGSSSIRTGLSGLQSPRRMSAELEHSSRLCASAREQNQRRMGSMHGELGKVPESITEDQSKLSPPEIFEDVSGKEESIFSGLRGASEEAPLSSAISANEKGLGASAVKVNEAIHPNVETDNDMKGYSRNDNEKSCGLSPASKNSRPWGKTNIGKRVNHAIKSVLSKASPRDGASLITPREPNQQESASLFSSVDDEDDDDDIFGGLEDDDDFGKKQSEAANFVSLKQECKGQKTDAKTPKQRNSKESGNKVTDSVSRRSRNAKKHPSKKKPTQASRSASTTPMSAKPQTPKSLMTNRKSIESLQATDVTAKNRSSYSKDRFGTIVDEVEVLHVNSDITSSLVGGPLTSPNVATDAKISSGNVGIDAKEETRTNESKHKSPASQSKSSRKLKSSRSSPEHERNSSLPTETNTFVEITNEDYRKPTGSSRAKIIPETANSVAEEKKVGSVFENISCGLAEHCSEGFARLCATGKKAEILINIVEDDAEKSFMSRNSSTDLTDLEKKVWTEWDRLNEHVKAQTTPSEAQEQSDNDKKQEHERKREAARDKLLDIASTAMNSQMPGKSNKEDGNDGGTAIMSEPFVSASVSTDSDGTKDSGASGMTSSTASAESRSALSSQEESSHGYSTEYSSGVDSDFVSKEPFPPTPTPDAQAADGAAPMLLSLSQRSLMEKFTKQLTCVGVEVLKLNRKKKWQVRHFTVSKERIALSAHEGISKSGDMAHCPKALLWLKKFNPHHGGYSISNIDKNGHGGMLLVDLAGIQVSNIAEDLIDNPLPKKLQEPFKESTLVTLDYKINGSPRCIEFRCKNNDEAQFLCTCMRVIRDLLRRERSLRQKSNKQLRTEMNAVASQSKAS